MNKAEYPIVVHPLCEEDGGGFTALAPDLVGCRGDGETVAKAIEDLYAAMDEWVDEIQRLERPIPAPYAYGERMVKERDSLDDLVDAQNSLIEAQENALKEHGDSISKLKDQVAALSLEVCRAPREPSNAATEKGKLWTAIGSSVPKRIPIVRRPVVAH